MSKISYISSLSSKITLPNSSDTLVVLSETQTLNNKTLVDSTTFFSDDITPSKKMQFQLANITASNTRTLTVPNFSDTLVGMTGSQTLTNKIMTGTNNVLTASVLKSATTEISISGATAPTNGQVLTASSSTVASWATPSGGGAPSNPYFTESWDNTFLSIGYTDNRQDFTAFTMLTNGTNYFKWFWGVSGYLYVMVSSSSNNTGWSAISRSSTIYTIGSGGKNASAILHNGRLMFALQDASATDTIKFITTTGLTYPFTFNSAVSITATGFCRPSLSTTADATPVPILICSSTSLTTLNYYKASNADGTAWGGANTLEATDARYPIIYTKGTGASTVIFIIYNYGATGVLKYTHSTNLIGTPTWLTPYVMYNTSPQTGGYSMTLSPTNNYPIIVHAQNTSSPFGIYYSIANTTLPTAIGNWTTHTIVNPLTGFIGYSNMGSGQFYKVNLYNGKPIVMYIDTSSSNLNIWFSNVASPTSSSDWTFYYKVLYNSTYNINLLTAYNVNSNGNSTYIVGGFLNVIIGTEKLSDVLLTFNA